MYIAPNTTIRLLRNVRLEPDYVNTIYFSSLSAQTSYFMGKTKYTLTAQSYQRVNKGVCRVNYKAEDLYDCNYMMFQNTSFGTKWFYAFITKVEYVNNVTADVYYEIDSIQSWLKDIIFSMCFVEREHSGSDEIGDNIVPEPIETGEMIFNNYQSLTEYLDTMAIAILTVDPQGSASGMPKDGIYSGAVIRAYANTLTGVGYLNDYIDTFNQKPDAIIGIYMFPVSALDSAGRASLETPNGATLVFSDRCEEYDFGSGIIAPLSTSDTIDGHIVRNKKLFTYPYNFFHIDNANGRELNLRYEFFTNNNGQRNYQPQLKMFSNITMPVTVVARPTNYKGVKNGDFVKTESIDITNYPMCSWNMDAWKAWVAQNSIPEAMSAYSGMLGIGAGIAGTAVVASGGTAALAVAGAAAGVALIGLVSGKLGEMYRASIRADIMKGSQNNGNINVCSHTQNFYIGRVSVNNKMAKIIDDFFDRFGYATNELKVPNITSRRSWNYIKTIGSNVDGNIPGDDKRIIDACFDRGITFWHNGDNVDNYSLNNDPVAP